MTPLPPRPAPPRRRSASAALEDLRDAPVKLRLLARWLHDEGDSEVSGDGTRVDGPDLRRWADDLDRLLEYSTWKGMVAAAEIAAVGFIVGALVMDLVR